MSYFPSKSCTFLAKLNFSWNFLTFAFCYDCVRVRGNCVYIRARFSSKHKQKQTELPETQCKLRLIIWRFCTIFDSFLHLSHSFPNLKTKTSQILKFCLLISRKFREFINFVWILVQFLTHNVKIQQFSCHSDFTWNQF